MMAAGNTRCPDTVGARDGSAVETVCGAEESDSNFSGLHA
jgi:hypothetical protein